MNSRGKFCILCVFVVTCSVLHLEGEISRVIEFSDYHPGIRLRPLQLGSFETHSSLSCAILCLYTYKCRSFNFCGGTTCELRQYTLQDFRVTHHVNSNEINNNSNCAHLGLSGDPRVANVDNWKSGAKTEFYIFDAIIEIDNETEFKQVKHRRCLRLDGSEVDASLCVDDPEVITHWLRWFKDVPDQLPWADAKDKCEQIGGELFGDIHRETPTQWLVSERLGARFWLGVYKQVNGSVWRNLGGEDVTQFVELEEVQQADMNEVHEYLVGWPSGQKVLYGSQGGHSHMPFACQMNL